MKGIPLNKETLYDTFFDHKGWKPLSYQKKAFRSLVKGEQGLINAPTGSGKTYSLLLPIFLQGLEANHQKGLFAIWVTPLRAISLEIRDSAEELNTFFDMGWDVAIRTGDTSTVDRQKQKDSPPQILITTPESIHLLLASKGYKSFFKTLKYFVVDEWHELLGSKRAVLIELALSRLKTITAQLRIWGISATIGNLEQGMEVLLGSEDFKRAQLIRSSVKKKIEIRPLIPKSLSEIKWAGNIGISLKHKVYEVIQKHKTTLIFTNTRAMTERWYQELLNDYPDLAGVMALHHGSLDREVRYWVEEAIHSGSLKAVVCTSSLDLGVDFRPVEAIVQVGSPKGVSRFFQRAGRSNHKPGEASIVYFLPTHSLEVIEYMALRDSLKDTNFEARVPHILSFDVLAQYLVTLAVSGGFRAEEIHEEVLNTHCFKLMEGEEWNHVLSYISTGGKALEAYGDYNKVERYDKTGEYLVKNRRVAMRHRLSIGTIVSDQMMRLRFKRGGYIGMIEERFISRLFEGDHFIFAGKTLKLVQIKDNVAIVQKSNSKKAQIPSYQGGRMSLSTQLGERLRSSLYQFKDEGYQIPPVIADLVKVQERLSALPSMKELLIEYYEEKNERHLFIYTFEGRQVHEALASLVAYRISQEMSVTFSLAFNDYGFQLLTGEGEEDLRNLDFKSLLSPKELSADLMKAINSAEMGRRRFRDIAGIAGLIFMGYPGKQMNERNLNSSTGLIYSVFSEYDPDHILFRQSLREVFEYQIEEDRLRKALQRVAKQDVRVVSIPQPTPFSLPLIADSMRERLTNEPVEEKLEKLLGFEKHSL